MRNTKCRFCSKIFNDKQKYCNHVAETHNDQVPEGCEPLEFAYSLLVNKPMGRVCVMCKQKPVKFNDTTLKYERLCSNPACKEAYVKMMKERMVKVYGKLPNSVRCYIIIMMQKITSGMRNISSESLVHMKLISWIS